MPTTKNGLKATKLRGHSRAYLVELPHRASVIEIEPGRRIEDIDTSTLEPIGVYTWTTHFSAHKLDRRDCEEDAQPGWYVTAETSNNTVGPVATKTDAVAEMRLNLTGFNGWYWSEKDDPAAVEIEVKRISDEFAAVVGPGAERTLSHLFVRAIDGLDAEFRAERAAHRRWMRLLNDAKRYGEAKRYDLARSARERAKVQYELSRQHGGNMRAFARLIDPIQNALLLDDRD